MTNTFNYAEKYTGEILEIINQGLLTSPFLTTNVNWVGAKDFHFTQQSVSGYKAHARNGGWNRGTVTETDKVYTVEHDRDIEFLVDKADVDETSRTAAIENISNTFVQTQQIPEIDCYAFSKIATIANANNLVEVTPRSSLTKDNVYSTIVKAIGKGKLKLYRQRGSLVGYVRSEIMDLLAISTEFTPTITNDTLVDGVRAVETRITKINGVVIIEVVDDDRFNTAFNFTEGAVAAGKEINMLFASVETVHTVPKIASIYYFNAGQHTEGDGDLYQNRSLWDTFVFPNGKDGKVDSVYAVLEQAIG